MAVSNGIGNRIAQRFFSAVKYRDYRLLWSAYLCSQSADWALIVARGALMLTLTNSPFWTALTTYAAMIPSVMVSPFAGYLADRFDRRRMLAAAYGANLAQNVLLAFLVISGLIQPWHLVVLAALTGALRSAQSPAAQSLMPNTVPQDKIFNAVSLFQSGLQGARFLGPLLLLIILWITGNDHYVFLVAVGLYALALLLEVNIHTTVKGEVMAGSGMSVVLDNMVHGLKYIYQSRLMLPLVILVVCHCALTMSFESLFPVISKDKLGMAPGAGFMEGFGYLMVAFGIAAFFSTMLLAGVESDKWRGRLLWLTAILSGLTPLALGFSSNIGLAVASVAGMGASQAAFMAINQGILQVISPEGVRGRVMGVYNWHILGFMATFNLINGTLVDITPLSASFILGTGGMIFIVIVLGAVGLVNVRQLYSGQYLKKRAGVAEAG